MDKVKLKVINLGTEEDFFNIDVLRLAAALYKACHSDDITAAPNGACEFIGIDMDSVKKYGGRYIVMSVNSYTAHHIKTYPSALQAGWPGNTLIRGRYLNLRLLRTRPILLPIQLYVFL
jgi:hypothetical protein